MSASKIAAGYGKIAPAPIPLKRNHEEEDECPLYIYVTTYLGYLMLTIFGHVRDFFGKIFTPGNYRHLKIHNVNLGKVFIVM